MLLFSLRLYVFSNNTFNWQTLSWSASPSWTTGFSLKSNFPSTQPPSQPATQPPGKVTKKQDRSIYPKRKLLVYVRTFWNRFWNDHWPKNGLVGAKKKSLGAHKSGREVGVLKYHDKSLLSLKFQFQVLFKLFSNLNFFSWFPIFVFQIFNSFQNFQIFPKFQFCFSNS